jgi:hypothetical protein
MFLLPVGLYPCNLPAFSAFLMVFGLILSPRDHSDRAGIFREKGNIIHTHRRNYVSGMIGELLRQKAKVKT